MSQSYDVIIIGGGIVGAATAFHVANLGCRNVLVLDRSEPGSGGTAQSCAIIRTHYSIPSNTQLAVRSLRAFKNLSEALADEAAESGFVQSGYIILAPRGPLADDFAQNLEQQREAGAITYSIDQDEATDLHPLLSVADAGAIAFEPESGYADPHLATTSFIKAAQHLGVEVRSGCTVQGVIMNGNRVTGVRTDDGDFFCGSVFAAIGPWSAHLQEWIGVELPLEVSRHTVLTFRGSEPYIADYPIVKDLTTGNKMYFRPTSGSLALVGTGDHGDPITDPDDMAVALDPDFVHHQGTQLANRVPPFSDGELINWWYGPYDITPDWNPVLGAVPEMDNLQIAYGFSGHGFKLAPAVGELMAQSLLGLPTFMDLTPYRLSRFEAGDHLNGVYGIGSIS